MPVLKTVCINKWGMFHKMKHPFIYSIGDRLLDGAVRAYERLPDQFQGLQVRRDTVMSGKRTGVWNMDQFFGRFLGCSGVPDDWRRWLYLPEHCVALVVNGAVFRDDLGRFTGIREQLKKAYPD